MAIRALLIAAFSFISASSVATAGTVQVEVARDGLWLLSSDGRRVVGLSPELELSVRPYEPGGLAVLGPGPARRMALSDMKVDRHGSGWTATASARHEGAVYVLRVKAAADDPQLRMELTAHYDRAVLVHHELARFVVGPVQQARFLDRAYRLVNLRRRAHVGALTPLVARFAQAGGPDLLLLGGSGLQGMALERMSHDGVSVTLELDHAANRPFRIYRRCVTHSARGQPVPKKGLSLSYRGAGTHRVVEARWMVGSVVPVLVGRFPAGRRAAIGLSDHADQSSASRVEAFAFGQTGAVAAGAVGPGYPGFVNRGLSYTKTIFLQRAGRFWLQFDGPRYRAVLDAMAVRGVEIGVHSPTGLRDRPADARRLLEQYRAVYAGRTWIDHQPDTNCEAITNQGWDRSGPWYMLGHLDELGFRYLWSCIDLPLAPGSLNLLAPQRQAARRPVLYHHSALGGPDGHDVFQLFTSAMLFDRRTRLLQRFSAWNLQRLVQERGLLVGHVYVDTGRRTGRYVPRMLIEREAPGHYQLRPDVDRLFLRLRQLELTGDLWVAGIAEMGDHILVTRKVDLQYVPHGVRVSLGVETPRPLRGLTLILPPRTGQVLVDNGPPDGRRDRGDAVEIWFDLQPGHPRLVRVMDAAKHPLSLARSVEFTLRGQP